MKGFRPEIGTNVPAKSAAKPASVARNFEKKLVSAARRLKRPSSGHGGRVALGNYRSVMRWMS
jgi:hypothetical protein